jgi:hypothetical protein
MAHYAQLQMAAYLFALSRDNTKMAAELIDAQYEGNYLTADQHDEVADCHKFAQDFYTWGIEVLNDRKACAEAIKHLAPIHHVNNALRIGDSIPF